MKSFILKGIVAGAAILAALPVLAGGARPAPGAGAAFSSDASNRFSFDLYKRLGEKPGNLFFSPYSVRRAVAIAAAGAEGDTKNQMDEALELSGESEHTWGLLEDRFKALDGHGSLKLKNADSLWVQKGFGFKKRYLQNAQKTFSSDIRLVDFSKEFQAVATDVAQWIKDKTMGLIDGQPPSLDPLTRMVICNTIYFKGKWINQFNKDFTGKAPFFTSDGLRLSTDMMSSDREFRCKYGENSFGQVLELPYEGGASMVIILPWEKDGLSKVEAALTLENFQSWTNKMSPREVAVFVPKFKTEQRKNLEGLLADMGMPLAFDLDKADFSGMTPNQIYISKVIHQSYVEVDEEGTEAAAATTVVMRTKSIRKRLEFRADHPFMYFIRDSKTGLILFAGRFEAPEAE